MEKKQTNEPANPKIRIFVHSAIFSALALLFYLLFRQAIIALILVIAALFFLITGLFFARITLVLYKVSKAITRGIGTFLTWVFMIPFFYICFVPGRLLQLLLHKDPMHRAFPTNEKTYWIDYEEDPDPDRFKRQF